MKIESIEISHHRLPLDPPFRASWDGRDRTYFDSTIVRVRTDEGLEGWGSGDLMVGFEGHEELFIGWDPMRIERHFTVLSHIDFHYGRCWPLDLALWDLMGKISNQPVWKLLGGRHDRVNAYASSGTLRDAEAIADTALQRIEEGFKAMKIRFHRGDWRDDIKVLETIRNAVGDRLELMVDCNQGWRMPWDVEKPWQLKDALQVARELEKIGVYWMEEPLYRHDNEGMKQLRAMTDIRIAGGEMTRDLSALEGIIHDRALDVIQPDAALVGGITGLRRIAQLAEASGVTFTPHTWTNGPGVVANLHLSAGVGDVPYLEFPFDPPEWSLARRDFVMAEPLDINANGELMMTDKPGFGIDLNEEMLKKTRLK
ncbi:mandelate racemase/muconate lactonizing enzyme family protein [Marinibactrum halimedae]|uniref:Isomerase n=1 Tax=Marinibactrum halimedae TaxID=1444977 RepID=A0AA37T8A3_9GAMM|nr:mandelate racemase/muconate lactonizing enzyme family protein [Marinibactrum halimedae]MCD9458157.1 mandelate racemase/muconate lactonizing enzyme family protein [Marinibactrum halimedae]GLS25090.1 isomerase [Marinibactrum halimedae]